MLLLAILIQVRVLITALINCTWKYMIDCTNRVVIILLIRGAGKNLAQVYRHLLPSFCYRTLWLKVLMHLDIKHTYILCGKMQKHKMTNGS